MKKLQNFKIAVLLLAVCTCFSCEEDEEAVVPNDTIINISVLDENDVAVTELPGDGETLIKVKAKVPHNADDAYRKITFKASKGQFQGATANGEYEKTVNSEGIAEVYLKVPLDDGPLFISAEIGTAADTYRDEKIINLLDVGQIIDLEILDEDLNPLSDMIKADGTTLLTIKASVNFNTDAFEVIKFLKSDGTFLSMENENNTVTIDENNEAIVRYRIPKTVGEVYFKVEASSNSNIFKNKTLTLSRAYADHIILEPSTLIIDSSEDTATITTYLVRNNGYVSTGTPAVYSAYQLDDQNNPISVGRFTGLANASTDSNGQINSVRFIADTGNIDFTKPIIIKVTATNDSGEEIYQSVPLNN